MPPRPKPILSTVFGILLISTEFGEIYSQAPLPAIVIDTSAKPVTYPPDIVAFLYTRRNPEEAQVIKPYDGRSLLASNFDPSRPTKVIVHGFLSSQKRGTGGSRLREALLMMMDVNVVQVDWSGMGSPSYVAARLGIPKVGRRVGRLLQLLVAVGGARYSDMHIIGHSLGAHVAGIAARTVGMGASRQGRITGLDPAAPGFWGQVEARLSPSDAGMVDVVHTCGGLLGLQSPLGQVDFYPNGGLFAQPGCGADVGGGCSHCLAYEFMRMAILEPSRYMGTRCSSWNSYKRGECEKEERVPMGMDLRPGASGIYYLEMHGWSPTAPKNSFAPENPLWSAGRHLISSVLSPAHLVLTRGRGPVAVDGGVTASC